MENKYIEAFENIIFQKRDNGYISDAYRNDIDIVYEALHKLENKEETMKDYSTKYGSNATVESFSETQKVGETYKIFVGDENPGSDHTSSKEYEKCIEETMEEYYDKCGIPKKYRNPNNIPGEIKIPTVIKNDLEKLKEIKEE